MSNIKYKNCLISIEGSDMYYNATIDMGLNRIYKVKYNFKTFEDVKKDIKKKLRDILKNN